MKLDKVLCLLGAVVIAIFSVLDFLEGTMSFNDGFSYLVTIYICLGAWFIVDAHLEGRKLRFTDIWLWPINELKNKS